MEASGGCLAADSLRRDYRAVHLLGRFCNGHYLLRYRCGMRSLYRKGKAVGVYIKSQTIIFWCDKYSESPILAMMCFIQTTFK